MIVLCLLARACPYNYNYVQYLGGASRLRFSLRTCASWLTLIHTHPPTTAKQQTSIKP
jgi:hypothetical protein